VKARTVLWRVAQLALVVVITWGIVRTLAPELARVSFDDFSRYPPSALRLLGSTALLLVFYVMHAGLWRGMTAELGGKRPTFRTALYIYFISGLGRYIPGKLWQIAGLALLAQRAGFSAVAATAASVIAQFAFITTGLLYLALMLPAWGGAAPALLALAAITIVVVAYRARHWTAMHIKRLQPAVDMLDRLTAGNALKWWLGYGLSWIILGAAFVLFTSAFVALAPSALRHVAGAVAAAYLGGLLAIFSIAGLGVREAVMGLLLVTVMPAPAALVVAVASRLWFTAGELLPILFARKTTWSNEGSRHNSDVQ
jgi:uncharacterized protein YjeT (DUF2065 family)